MIRLELSIELGKILDDYNDKVIEVVQDEGEKLAKKAVSQLKATSPKKRGKYASGWRSKKIAGSKGNFESVVYNGPYPGLTHLLENGHITRNGGRTKAQPHIKPVEEQIKKEYEQNLKARLS